MNSLVLGDYNELIKLVPDNHVNLIITDFPYVVTKEAWDKEDLVTPELVSQLYRILKDTGSLYVWCGIGEKSQSLIRWYPKFAAVFYFKDLITWKKQRGIGMRKGWLYTREELMWFVKDNKKFIWNTGNQYSTEKREKSTYGYILKNGKKADDYIKSDYKRYTNVWTDISETSFNTSKFGLVGKHFTPKPIKALERIIELHTKEEDLVFDPTFGSGSSAVASQNLNRNFLGFEKNPEYYQLARKRLNLPKT